MMPMNKIAPTLLAVVAAPIALLACTAVNAPISSSADAASMTVLQTVGPVVGMRRLTEAQYRNSVADIFGPDIDVAGRFEPIVRPAHHLIATGASTSAVSPAGLEQFDAIARAIAGQVFDEAHRKIFVTCTPKDQKQPDPDCARKVLTPIGRYAFRRPLTLDEQSGYVQMAGDSATQTGSFYSGLELALAAMLVSPNFLYVIESGEVDPQRPEELRLANYSRAARLSFLLWNTTPNDALLKAAAQDHLTDDAQLTAIATKMVDSPRLEDGVRAFFADMLLFEKFDEIAKDPLVYPRFNPTVASALPEQMLRMIIDHVVTRDGDYRELFTTRRTFMNRALGPLYNVPVRSRDGWEPYEFAPESGRAGLLSQAGFLALYSHSGRSSPTLRGRAVRELLLCQPVPNPPGNVNFTAVQDTNNQVLRTARARLNAHNTDPVCSACHKITDPIGLPLEPFDGIGAYRRLENNAEIDTTGTFEGANFVGAAGLGQALAATQSTTECVAGRALEYATGRSPQEDTDRIMALEKAFAADDYRISKLFLRIATMREAYQIQPAPEQSREPVMAMSTTDQARIGAAQ